MDHPVFEMSLAIRGFSLGLKEAADLQGMGVELVVECGSGKLAPVDLGRQERDAATDKPRAFSRSGLLRHLLNGFASVQRRQVFYGSACSTVKDACTSF